MPLGAGVQRVIAIAAVGALLGCSDPDAGCPDGGSEFGNDACARIAGVVRAPSGEPLSGVVVTTRARSDDPAAYSAPSATTGPLAAD